MWYFCEFLNGMAWHYRKWRPDFSVFALDRVPFCIHFNDIGFISRLRTNSSSSGRRNVWCFCSRRQRTLSTSSHMTLAAHGYARHTHRSTAVAAAHPHMRINLCTAAFPPQSFRNENSGYKNSVTLSSVQLFKHTAPVSSCLNAWFYVKEN